MGIQLTAQEMELVKQGKLDVQNINEHRKLHPIKTINVNAVDQLKLEIKEAHRLYKESIQKNKDLYQQLIENRKHKEEMRNKISGLRTKKKQMLGLE